MKNSTLKKTRDAMKEKKVRWVSELANALWVSRAIVHRHLKKLVEQWSVLRNENGAHTTYQLQEFDSIQNTVGTYVFSYQQTKILNENFYKISPIGKPYEWKDWFVDWCSERWLDPTKKIYDFIAINEHIQSLKNECGLLDVTDTFRNHIESGAIDILYYADQYKWMDFGRWKLAEITFYAKSTQTLSLLKQSINLVKYQLECLIQSWGIDAIAFTPHSTKRSIQLLEYLKKNISLHGLPLVSLSKYTPHGFAVAQKSLKTRKQRIQNARETIVLEENDLSHYTTVLLIDDFVGSGATLNETAKKLKNAWANKVIWFAFVGNLNLSYDVIREI